MSKRKIAIIGLGKISIDQHVPVIAAGGDVATAAHIARQVAQAPATAASPRAAVGRWFPALFGQDAGRTPATDDGTVIQVRFALIAELAGA